MNRCGVGYRKYLSKALTIFFIVIAGSEVEARDDLVTKLNEVKSLTERPNIVLIMADDMGWGDAEYNGNTIARTANLDAMAAAGVRFNRAYAAAPVCSPTRGSVLTGRHPYRYGVCYANVGSLRPEENTLAEMLGESGYRTGFFGKWHLGTLTGDTIDANRGGRAEYAKDYSPPYPHGFQTVFATESKVPTFDPMIEPKDNSRSTWWGPVRDSRNVKSFGTYFWDEDGKVVSENLEGDVSRVIVDRAIPFIEDAVREKTPFLAVIWIHTPHLPVMAGHADQAAISTDDSYTGHYFGSIRAMDRQIGRVRSELKRLGIDEHTLLWFASDKGPEHEYDGAPGSTGGLRAAKRSLYEGGIRVPAIIEWPTRFAENLVVNAPIVTSDILPTMIDYVGLGASPTRELDGITLRPIIEGARTTRGSGIGFESNSQIAWVEDRFKIIHQPSDERGNPTLQGTGIEFGQNSDFKLTYELYDLLQDPGETVNLASEMPRKLPEFQENLNRWRRSFASSIEHYEIFDREETSTDVLNTDKLL